MRGWERVGNGPPGDGAWEMTHEGFLSRAAWKHGTDRIGTVGRSPERCSRRADFYRFAAWTGMSWQGLRAACPRSQGAAPRCSINQQGMVIARLAGESYAIRDVRSLVRTQLLAGVSQGLVAFFTKRCTQIGLYCGSCSRRVASKRHKREARTRRNRDRWDRSRARLHSRVPEKFWASPT